MPNPGTVRPFRPRVHLPAPEPSENGLLSDRMLELAIGRHHEASDWWQFKMKQFAIEAYKLEKMSGRTATIGFIAGIIVAVAFSLPWLLGAL